jgi:hypothetical protein
MSNLQFIDPKVKHQLSRSQAIEAGQRDQSCIDLQSFILIKNRRTQMYDYVPGNAGLLFSDDIPQAEYFLGKGAKWEHNTDCYIHWKKQQERTK